MNITRTSPLSGKTRTLDLPIPDTFDTTELTKQTQIHTALDNLTTEQKMFLLEGNLWEDLEQDENPREGEERYHK